MTKKKRIMVSLDPTLVKIIDASIKHYNEDIPIDAIRMTRSILVEMCITAFLMQHDENEKANEPKQGE